MASSLSNIVNNLSGGIPKIKYKYRSDDKKCETCGIKGVTKLYFTHYSCVVAILSNNGLYKSAYFTYSFGKLVFVSLRVLCFLSVLNSM